MWTEGGIGGGDNISAMQMMAFQPVNWMSWSIDLETLVSKDFEAEI